MKNPTRISHPRSKSAAVAFSALAFALVFTATSGARTWTSADGSKTFEGDLKSYDADAGVVTVVMRGGRLAEFAQDMLSAEDITYLKEEESNPIAVPPPLGGGTLSSSAKDLPDVLPDPDGEEADMSKPVQVYILLGQSNMLGSMWGAI